MTGQELRERLRSGKRVYGSMLVGVSPRWPSAAKGAGLDFAFIDTEHHAHNRSQLSWLCQLYAANGVVPVVRIPSPDAYEASVALDAGARGVIAPYVETVEQTRRIVGATKYRPIKGAKLENALDGSAPFEPAVAERLERQNAHNVAIVNIESVPAMDALNDIVAVDGLDAVLIGPHDLSFNLDVPGDYRNPLFVDACDKIITTARDAGIGAGIHVAYGDSFDQETRWAKLGANLIVHSVDIAAFSGTLRRELDAIKKELGDE